SARGAGPRARRGRAESYRTRTWRAWATRSRATRPRSCARRWPRAASACRPARGAPDVDFRPTPAKQLLAATAREMLRKHCPPEVAQRVALDARGLDPGLWRQLAELGWPGLLIPSELGGSDGSLLDVVVLVEE